jgi:hypothetical protein
MFLSPSHLYNEWSEGQKVQGRTAEIKIWLDPLRRSIFILNHFYCSSLAIFSSTFSENGITSFQKMESVQPKEKTKNISTTITFARK